MKHLALFLTRQPTARPPTPWAEAEKSAHLGDVLVSGMVIFTLLAGLVMLTYGSGKF